MLRTKCYKTKCFVLSINELSEIITSKQVHNANLRPKTKRDTHTFIANDIKNIIYQQYSNEYLYIVFLNISKRIVELEVFQIFPLLYIKKIVYLYTNIFQLLTNCQ